MHGTDCGTSGKAGEGGWVGGWEEIKELACIYAKPMDMDMDNKVVKPWGGRLGRAREGQWGKKDICNLSTIKI